MFEPQRLRIALRILPFGVLDGKARTTSKALDSRLAQGLCDELVAIPFEAVERVEVKIRHFI